MKENQLAQIACKFSVRVSQCLNVHEVKKVKLGCVYSHRDLDPLFAGLSLTVEG